jgi:glycosyltransferase involved in cell wall biosynthesis
MKQREPDGPAAYETVRPLMKRSATASADRPLKICVVVARFSYTGVPLAQIRFARALAARGHHVELVFGSAPAELPDRGQASLVVLGQASVKGMLVPMCRYLRRAKPDLVFSSQDHLNGIVLLAAILTRSRAKISGSSRVNPFYTYSNRPLTRKWVFKWAMKAVMGRADALTCVSAGMVDEYRVFFPDPPHVPVHNIIDDAPSRAKISDPVDHPWFVAGGTPIVIGAGTLSPRKGFADLISAFARLVEAGRDVRLVIFGEGPSRAALEQQVRDLGLEARVALPGRIPNPLPYFARSDVFALTSYFEGLPNVLIEAMMCGCSLIATDCPSGSSEALGHGRYGKVVPVGDTHAIAGALADLLDSPTDPALLAEGVESFGEGAVLRRHFELLGLPGRQGSPT